MITITRRVAQQLRSVLRRAFSQARTGPVVGFFGSVEGLIVRSAFGDTAVELRVPGTQAAETVWLPYHALDDFEGKKDEPVELTMNGKGRATAQWRDGSVPQIVQCDAVKPPAADKFPTLPTDLTANPPALLQALHEASEVAVVNSSRFATDCLQLTPTGTIQAADGHQALVQSGFSFPWKKPMLVPRSKVFHSPELPHDKPVSVAQSGEWLALGVEPWTIYLRINVDGRYPDMEKVIPDPANATTRCQLSEADQNFLADTLPKLPGGDEQYSPVTLDLNGHVSVRAKSADQPTPTEVVLVNSNCTGEALRINTNRAYLKRALKLGLRELYFYGDGVALLGQSENRKLVWMPLEPGAAIAPTEDAIRIESSKVEPSAVPATSPSVKPKTERKPKPVNETTPNTNGKATTNGQAKPETNGKPSRRKAGRQDLAALIEQAIKLRTALHEKTQEAGELVRALKQHRRANRAIQNTLSSIRQLKGLGV